MDVFRALTMLFMLFVNDFWTLTDIPNWLKHSPASVDFLGFSDVIFPCFLFILGMAIPFAIDSRRKKGESEIDIVRHILIRSFALLVMGVFTVNYENFHPEANLMSKALFGILMTIGFFLVWNAYPKASEDKNRLFWGLKVLGTVLLIYLAMAFRGTGGESGDITRWEPRWWGILGLIGWAYLGAALVYWLAKGKTNILIISWGIFTLLNVGSHADWFNEFPWISSWIVGNGAFHSFALSGMIGAVLLKEYADSNSKLLLNRLGLMTIGMLALGFISHEFFIISKIKATPPWIFFCCAIGFGFIGLLYWLVDKHGKEAWFSFIRPAGDSTLTCYLIPYIYYNLGAITGIGVPDFLKTGTLGLAKSILFALLMVFLTGELGKRGIRLKI